MIQSQQPKLWISSPFVMSTCRDEVGKWAKVMSPILIIYAATDGERLVKVMANNVLMLHSWDKGKSAMFAFSGDGGLLWRPVAAKAGDAGYENKAFSSKEEMEKSHLSCSRRSSNGMNFQTVTKATRSLRKRVLSSRSASAWRRWLFHILCW